MGQEHSIKFTNENKQQLARLKALMGIQDDGKMTVMLWHPDINKHKDNPPPHHFWDVEAEAKTIASFQKKGYHAFFAVNEFGGRYRKIQDCKYLRAFFLENDGQCPIKPHEFDIQPTFVVDTSPGKQHMYWVFEEPIKATANTIKRYAAINQGLCDRFGGDQNAKDLARVLRLPGTYNLKPSLHQPFEAKINVVSGKPYKWADLVQAAMFQPAELVTKTSIASTDFQPSYVKEALDFIPPKSEAYGDSDGETYTAFIQSGMALHSGSGGSQAGFELWDNYWAEHGFSTQDDADERRTKWASFDLDRDNAITLGTIFGVAEKNGWRRRSGLNIEQIGRFVLSPPPPREFLINDLIPEGEMGFLTGGADLGKSYLTVDMAWAVATGDCWLGNEEFKINKPGRIVMLNAEDERDDVVRRLHARWRFFKDMSDIDRLELSSKELLDFQMHTANTLENNIYFKCLADQIFTLSDGKKIEASVDRLANDIDLIDNVRMIVLDPAVSFDAGDENDNRSRQVFVQALRRLCKLTDTTLLVVHHDSQSSSSERGAVDSAGRGATSFRAGSRFGFKMVRATEQSDWVPKFLLPKAEQEINRAVRHFCLLEHNKHNYTKPYPDMLLRRNFDYMGLPRHVIADVEGTESLSADEIELIETLKKYEITPTKITRHWGERCTPLHKFGNSKEDVVATIMTLVDRGYLIKPSRGPYKVVGGL